MEEITHLRRMIEESKQYEKRRTEDAKNTILNTISTIDHALKQLHEFLLREESKEFSLDLKKLDHTDGK